MTDDDLPLFAGADRTHRMAAVTDPATSKQAAVDAQGFAAGHRTDILRALVHFGVHGGTAKEIADYLGNGFDSVAVSRRIDEMRRLEWIVSFDGLEHQMVMRPVVKRKGCAVHVVKEHAAAASAIFANDRARAEQLKQAQRIVA